MKKVIEVCDHLSFKADVNVNREVGLDLVTKFSAQVFIRCNDCEESFEFKPKTAKAEIDNLVLNVDIKPKSLIEVKTKTVTDSAHPKFLVKTGKDGQFYFNLTAKNGQVILSSEGYKAKAGCENGIESVKKNSQVDERFERKEAKDGHVFFTLEAANGEVIGKSEMYTTKAAMENGIESVKKNAPNADINYI
jgi:uncharacterized protein YegP (UPF0339 family)